MNKPALEAAIREALDIATANWCPSSGGCWACEGGNVKPCPMQEMQNVLREALNDPDYPPFR